MTDSGWPSDFLGARWVDDGMREGGRFTELLPRRRVVHDVTVRWGGREPLVDSGPFPSRSRQVDNGYSVACSCGAGSGAAWWADRLAVGWLMGHVGLMETAAVGRLHEARCDRRGGGGGT